MSDDFRQKLFQAAGMPYTKSQQNSLMAESIGTAILETPGQFSGTKELLTGSPTRRPSVSGYLEGTNRRSSLVQQGQFSPNMQNTNTGSRRSTVLAELESAPNFSLGPSNFFSRQKAVKDALVQSIIRRKERNGHGGSSSFLFPSSLNQTSTVASTVEDLQNADDFSSVELKESISDFIKLGVHVTSTWLQDELRISPTAKKRFEIFRNPTPEFPDDPTTPQSGMNLYCSRLASVCMHIVACPVH